MTMQLASLETIQEKLGLALDGDMAAVVSLACCVVSVVGLVYTSWLVLLGGYHTAGGLARLAIRLGRFLTGAKDLHPLHAQIMQQLVDPQADWNPHTRVLRTGTLTICLPRNNDGLEYIQKMTAGGRDVTANLDPAWFADVVCLALHRVREIESVMLEERRKADLMAVRGYMDMSGPQVDRTSGKNPVSVRETLRLVREGNQQKA